VLIDLTGVYRRRSASCSEHIPAGQSLLIDSSQECEEILAPGEVAGGGTISERLHDFARALARSSLRCAMLKTALDRPEAGRAVPDRAAEQRLNGHGC
jgi:hypothetical protein